jgi:hypothetical protein
LSGCSRNTIDPKQEQMVRPRAHERLRLAMSFAMLLFKRGCRENPAAA